MKLSQVSHHRQNQPVYFFDLDDTLVFTSKANALAYQKALKKIAGLTLPNQVNLHFTTNPQIRVTREYIKMHYPFLSNKERAAITFWKEVYYREYLKETEVNHVLLRFLKEVAKDSHIFLVTQAKEGRMQQVLAYYGLHSLFCEVFSNASTSSPNKYENALSQWGINPNQVILFEDDPQEFIYGKEAGIPGEQIKLVA